MYRSSKIVLAEKAKETAIKHETVDQHLREINAGRTWAADRCSKSGNSWMMSGEV